MAVLAMILVLSFSPVVPPDFLVNVVALQKKDLPDGFPARVLEEDFAILQITIQNRMPESEVVNIEDLEVFDQKKKRIERALPTDIAPKLVKFYQGNPARLHGEASIGGGRQWGPIGAHRGPNPYRLPESGSRQIPATLGQDLRELLEKYELKPSLIGSGETVEGFYYLKSKKQGQELNGSTLQCGDLSVTF